MTRLADCLLIGQWRIVEADHWDGNHLELAGPATLIIDADGRDDIAFGALQGGLDIGHSRTIVHFTWFGIDEMDDVTGTGSTELNDDGSLEIEFAYLRGDEAILTATPMTSSTAC